MLDSKLLDFFSINALIIFVADFYFIIYIGSVLKFQNRKILEKYLSKQKKFQLTPSIYFFFYKK